MFFSSCIDWFNGDVFCLFFFSLPIDNFFFNFSSQRENKKKKQTKEENKKTSQLFKEFLY